MWLATRHRRQGRTETHTLAQQSPSETQLNHRKQIRLAKQFRGGRNQWRDAMLLAVKPWRNSGTKQTRLRACKNERHSIASHESLQILSFPGLFCVLGA